PSRERAPATTPLELTPLPLPSPWILCDYRQVTAPAWDSAGGRGIDRRPDGSPPACTARSAVSIRVPVPGTGALEISTSRRSSHLPRLGLACQRTNVGFGL